MLESIEGGADLPSEREFVASIDTFKAERNGADARAQPTSSSRRCRCRAQPPAARAARRPVPARTYPPLEPRS